MNHNCSILKFNCSSDSTTCFYPSKWDGICLQLLDSSWHFSIGPTYHYLCKSQQFSYFKQAFSGLDEEISKRAKFLGNTALDAALNAQFFVQIGIFTAVPMIMGFILELGLLKVCTRVIILIILDFVILCFPKLVSLVLLLCIHMY